MCLIRADDRLLKIEDLKPSTNYVLKVRAKNEVGVGEYVSLREKTEDISKQALCNYLIIKINNNLIVQLYHDISPSIIIYHLPMI